jgi:uncharacterized membrane protein YfcA
MSGQTSALAIHALVMAAIGILAATIGSLAGLGGGFIVAPVLRIAFDLPPEQAAATSLVLVVANVASASVAFVRQGRVDMRLALTMGLPAIPGSIAGAYLVKRAPVAWFDLTYAAMLAFLALDLLRRKREVAAGSLARIPWSKPRTFHDRVSGADITYTQSPPIAAIAGITMGFLSSFFGIGGGVIVVPILLRVFAMPAHIVSATSHMVILFSAPFGVATHALQGNIYWLDAAPLAAGGLIGGQFGAAISRKISGVTLVRFLATVLGLAAVGLMIDHVDALAGLLHRKR